MFSTWGPIQSADTFAHEYDFKLEGTSFSAARTTQLQTLLAIWDRIALASRERPDAVDLAPAARALIRIANIPGLEDAAKGIKRLAAPAQEHLVLKAGHWLQPQPEEDYIVHMKEHMAELQRAQRDGEDPAYMDRLTDHIAATEVEARKLVAQQQAVASQMGMAGEEQEG